MIEVEKKFELNPEQEKRLIQGAELIGIVSQEDVYWDTADYFLTMQDHWLRTRNGIFELKRRLHELGYHKLSGTFYDEIEDEETIRNFLKLKGQRSLETDLHKAGFKPFATIRKQRRKYQRGDFHIDLDVCDFGYEVAEIELMIDETEDREKALERIELFARSLGLSQTRVRGKMSEYLYRYRREHFDALVKAGVI